MLQNIVVPRLIIYNYKHLIVERKFNLSRLLLEIQTWCNGRYTIQADQYTKVGLMNVAGYVNFYRVVEGVSPNIRSEG